MCLILYLYCLKSRQVAKEVSISEDDLIGSERTGWLIFKTPEEVNIIENEMRDFYEDIKAGVNFKIEQLLIEKQSGLMTNLATSICLSELLILSN